MVESYRICPACGKNKFKYISKIKANKCQNDLCRYTDEIKPAYDVPMSFLEFCLRNAKNDIIRGNIGKIIDLTKKVTEEVEQKGLENSMCLVRVKNNVLKLYTSK